MTKKISTNSTNNSENCDHNYSDTLANLLTVWWNYQTYLAQNQMKNEYQCAECQQTISNLEDSLDSVCKDCNRKLLERVNQKKSVSSNNPSPMRMSIRLSFRKNKQIDEKIQCFMEKIATVKNHDRNLGGEFLRPQNSLRCISRECASLQINVQQQNDAIKALKLKQDVSIQELLRIKQILEDLHYATYDGSLIWIIDEFQRKFNEAVDGQQTSIDSPAFYSSSFGYKMRARLHLNGYGDAYRTHMSISLVIFKGDYDPILTWPFNFPVTFRLFDQTGQGYHFTDSFRPDSTSVSFQQPRSNENTASGIPKFFPLPILQQQQEGRYVQNDKMYIEITVDFLGIPRPVLPYTSSVNPALPILEQEAIRHRLIEEHNQAEAEIIDTIIENDQEVANLSLMPVRTSVPAGSRQEPTPSTNNAQVVPCVDIPHL